MPYLARLAIERLISAQSIAAGVQHASTWRASLDPVTWHSSLQPHAMPLFH